jgi:hypothetical protein
LPDTVTFTLINNRRVLHGALAAQGAAGPERRILRSGLVDTTWSWHPNLPHVDEERERALPTEGVLTNPQYKDGFYVGRTRTLLDHGQARQWKPVGKVTDQ